MRVLIVKISSMGDVVHALPMVSDIARVFPHARIDWVIEEAFADIPRLHPAVARVFPIALRRWRRELLRPGSWRQMLEARRALRKTRYHTIIDCQGLLKSAAVAWNARGPVTGFGPGVVREPLAALLYRRRVFVDPRLHAIDRIRRLGAAALGYALEMPERFGLRLPQAEGEPEAPPFALLLSNASRASKLWPDQHWLMLEQALARRGLQSWLVWGSHAEHEISVLRAAQMQSAHVLPKSSIAQIAALAARARIVVGLDTGLTHLAAALGAPTVGIFCDYDTTLVGLRGGERAISLGGVAQVPSVEQVCSAVDRLSATCPQ
ncbi:MAG TPA: lipopolysaccharide heptosyltransferase I [Burkholderiaceae bacterium]|nr:lipopolysaccharide heptosyltransferase I [Burkholderiaceae bacterium]